MAEVEVIQVIRTELTLRGSGKQPSPMRRVTQFWAFDGGLLAERDPELEIVGRTAQSLCKTQRLEGDTQGGPYLPSAEALHACLNRLLELLGEKAPDGT